MNFEKNYGSRKVRAIDIIKAIYNMKRPSQPKAMRSDENINRVRESMERYSETSIRRRAQQLKVKKATLQRIIRKDLCLACIAPC